MATSFYVSSTCTLVQFLREIRRCRGAFRIVIAAASGCAYLRPAVKRSWQFVPAAFALFLLPACGRPATEAECDEIVGRIAELELKEAKSADPADVQRQVTETKEAFRSKMKTQCVGKRVTDYALRCVRNAKTAEEIVQKCLD